MVSPLVRQPDIVVPVPRLAVQRQILIRTDASDLYTHLTCWSRLPALIPVSPMLEVASGDAIDAPAIAGDMLLGRNQAGEAERLFIVTTAVDGLLWSVASRNLRPADADDDLHLTLAVQSAFDVYSLLVVQIVGGRADLIDEEGLDRRLEYIRVNVEGRTGTATRMEQPRAPAIATPRQMTVIAG